MSKELAVAGHLKPEVRLGIALSHFALALDDKRRLAFKQAQASMTQPPSATDVIRLTEELNRQGARLHKTWRPHGTRLGVFLRRIQKFASIGDVLIGSSQNLIAGGVWFAVRATLEASIGYFSYFEKISSLFMNLGTSWSIHSDFARLFPSCREIQIFLAEYLIVLVTLCTRAVLFAKKPTIIQFTSSLGSSFETEVKPLQAELDQWGRLIEQKANMLSMEAVLRSETAASERNKTFLDILRGSSKDKSEKNVKAALLQKLCPNQDDYEAIFRHERRKGSCSWLQDHQQYKAWKSNKSSSVLWLHGSLGSGKTVALANIVADISLQGSCASFFCRPRESKTLKTQNILGSLALQLLDTVPSQDQAWLRKDTVTGQQNISTGWISQLLDAVLPTDKTHFVVLDGLDECEEEVIEQVTKTLRSIVESKSILLCWSSRHETLASRIAKDALNVHYSIALGDMSRESEMEDYISAQIESRRSVRHLDPELEKLAKDQLLAGAHGMYLWVSLQLDAIFPPYGHAITSDADIFNLLTNLPKNLPEAFDRALGRTKDTRYGSRLFKIVSAADPPLTLNELIEALNVVPGDLHWDESMLPQDAATVVTLCGGNLIEIDEEDTRVRFIHHSALLHLLGQPLHETSSQYHFSAEDAEMHLGAICVTYLHYPDLSQSLMTQRTAEPRAVLSRVMETPGMNPLLRHVTQHLSNRKRNTQLMPINITRVIQDVQESYQLSHGFRREFLKYASVGWLRHSRRFHPDVLRPKHMWDMWKALVRNKKSASTAGLPWVETIPSPGIVWRWASLVDDLQAETIHARVMWAVANSHAAIFLYYMNKERLPKETISTLLESNGISLTKAEFPKKYLGNISEHVLRLESLNSHDLVLLNRLGASFDVPASILETRMRLYLNEILEGIADTLPNSWPLLRKILQNQEISAALNHYLVSDILVRLIPRFPDAAVLILQCVEPSSNDSLAVDGGPLIMAVQAENLRLVELLLAKGADPNAPFRQGHDWYPYSISPSFEPTASRFNRIWRIDWPLHLALLTRRWDIASVLIEAGADQSFEEPAMEIWNGKPYAGSPSDSFAEKYDAGMLAVLGGNVEISKSYLLKTTNRDIVHLVALALRGFASRGRGDPDLLRVLLAYVREDREQLFKVSQQPKFLEMRRPLLRAADSLDETTWWLEMASIMVDIDLNINILIPVGHGRMAVLAYGFCRGWKDVERDLRARGTCRQGSTRASIAS